MFEKIVVESQFAIRLDLTDHAILNQHVRSDFFQFCTFTSASKILLSISGQTCGFSVSSPVKQLYTGLVP